MLVLVVLLFNVLTPIAALALSHDRDAAVPICYAVSSSDEAESTGDTIICCTSGCCCPLPQAALPAATPAYLGIVLTERVARLYAFAPLTMPYRLDKGTTKPRAPPRA